MSSPTFDSLRETLKQLRRRRSFLFILKQGSYFVIASAIVVLLASSITVWLEPNKLGSIIIFAVTATARTTAVAEANDA